MPRLKNTMSFEEKKQEAFRFFVEKGYTPAQAAGIVGNLIAESSLNTTIKGDKNTSDYAVGLAQWRLDRKDNLRRRYGDGWTDFYNQLDFVDWELKNTHKFAYNQMLKADSPEEVALVIAELYEAPRGAKGRSLEKLRETDSSKWPLHTKERQANALKLYQAQDQNIYSTDSKGQIVTVNPEYATPQQVQQSEMVKNQFYNNYLTNLGIPTEITTFADDNDFVVTEDETTGTTIINNYYETPKEEVKEEKPEVSEAQQRLQAKKAERQFLVDLVSSGAFDLQAPQYNRTSIMKDGGKVKIINEQGEEEMIDRGSQRYRDYYSEGDIAALNTETGDLMMSQDAVIISPGDYNPDIPQQNFKTFTPQDERLGQEREFSTIEKVRENQHVGEVKQGFLEEGENLESIFEKLNPKPTIENIDTKKYESLSEEDRKEVNRQLIEQGFVKIKEIPKGKENIKELQRELVNLGYDLGEFGENKDGVDGIAGRMTTTALKKYNEELLTKNHIQTLSEIKNKPNIIKQDEINVGYRDINYEEDCNNYYGCVAGGVKDMIRTLGVGETGFRRQNNLYGDAWQIIDNTFGEEIDITDGYEGVRPGDIISLSRNPVPSDKKRGIPEKEQHFGYITKIENGIPYVRHYINSTNSYYEEPINNIQAFSKYQPSRVKRPDSLRTINIDDEKVSTPHFTGNIQEDKIITSINEDKEIIQKTLRLDNTEYSRLSRLAYGIIGAESDFGESRRTVARMLAPDFVQKLIKMTQGNYNKETNDLSRGYSSIKASSMYNISDNRDIKSLQEKIGLKGKDVDGIWGQKSKQALKDYNERNPENQIEFLSLKEKLDKGDYRDLSKTQNYLHNAMSSLGLDSENLEDPKNSYKATMAFLSHLIKRNPNISDEEIIKAYTGKKNAGAYGEKVQKYMQNFEGDKETTVERGLVDNIYGKISALANFGNSSVKEVKSKILEVLLKDKNPLPINIKALLSSVSGANFTFTEEHLSGSAKDKLKEIIKNNVGRGKYTINYGDYIEEGEDVFANVGGSSDMSSKQAIKKALTNDAIILQQFLGQASIVDLGDGVYEIRDSYDFNDQGESFGIRDEVDKRGASPYTVVRAIGRTQGKADGLGQKVTIKIKI